jgi:hypothetical protein
MSIVFAHNTEICSVSINEPVHHHITWRIAVQMPGSQFLFSHLEFLSSDRPSQVMQKVISTYLQHFPFLRRITNNFILFRRPVLESATLSPASSTHLEANSLPAYVLLDTRTRNSVLTSAFYNPSILDAATDPKAFFATYRNFEAGFQGPGTVQQLCVVGDEFDHMAFCCFSIVVVVLCIGFGGLVGYMTRSVEAGCALGGGLASLVAGLELLILKLLR